MRYSANDDVIAKKIAKYQLWVVFRSNTLCCKQTFSKIMFTLSAKKARPVTLATGKQIAIVVIKAFVIERWQTAVTFWTKLKGNGVVDSRITPKLSWAEQREKKNSCRQLDKDDNSLVP